MDYFKSEKQKKDYFFRENRKAEHIDQFLQLEDEASTGLEDVKFIHHFCPETAWDEIDTTVSFCGKLGSKCSEKDKIAYPILIDAMTGGTEQAVAINRTLAQAAKEFSIPMALGSFAAGLENNDLWRTYQVAREENPNGILIGNIGAHASKKDAEITVEALEADCLEIHFNCPQELFMPEGDRNFSGMVENVLEIASALPIPVIVKEVGFGMMGEEVAAFYQAGIRGFDVGGYGGTNFIQIEKERSRKLKRKDLQLSDEILFDNWGNTTAHSIVEARAAAPDGLIIGSGGVRHGLEIAKTIALGSDLAGQAGVLLKALLQRGEKALFNVLEQEIRELKIAMMMLGAKNIEELKKKEILIFGDLYHTLSLRDLRPERFARREK